MTASENISAAAGTAVSALTKVVPLVVAGYVLVAAKNAYVSRLEVAEPNAWLLVIENGEQKKANPFLIVAEEI